MQLVLFCAIEMFRLNIQLVLLGTIAGNEMKSETYDPNEMLKKWGKKVAILGWYEIQTAFYRALPPDTVVFNSRRVTLTL